jgi:peptidoglycan/xylan/chitin deacetylase (PgdA/CDA1 family)/SAM-dependent methyltransferase
MQRPNISVIIPAHNAAETLSETLSSLLSQSSSNWEAIIVDDGSADETMAIAKGFAEQDPRIQVVGQPQAGVCAARNHGISLSRFDWLLFLDADDWIAQNHLERLTDHLVAHPDLDAVHCGWVRVAPDGTLVGEKRGPTSPDLFVALTRYCPFAIHACIVRCTVVEAVGGFDTSFQTCEDWDLWQRIARSGGRFGAIPDTLAFYRIRQKSLSSDGTQFFVDGLRMLEQGHTSDPRVSHPHPNYAEGLSPEELVNLKFQWASWPAGLVLGQGQDARHLLELLGEGCAPGLDPFNVAECIFESAPLPTCQTPAGWDQLWAKIGVYVHDFLIALESRSKAIGLARRALIILERMILQHSTAPRPLTIGTTHAVQLEVTQTIPNVTTPASVERLQCAVELEGSYLGTIELPVCEGVVSSYVLSDAIAAEFSWIILGRFFEHTVYLKQVEKLANLSDHHNQVGWTVFLQELWGYPDWSGDRFYDLDWKVETTSQQHSDDEWLVVEMSEPLPDVTTTEPNLDILITVGGVAIGTITIPAQQNVVTAQALRVAILAEAGLELCRACVREGLLGRPINASLSLRECLSEAAKTNAQRSDWSFTPCSSAYKAHLAQYQDAILLGQNSAAIGTSRSRRAILPGVIARDLVDAAVVAGEPVVYMSQSGNAPEVVIQAPELVWRLFKSNPSSTIQNHTQTNSPIEAQPYGRQHFESLFAKQPDPWKYTSPYEQTKYEQTLALLPSIKIERALEIACAEGHFTTQLAPRVNHLIATDISQIAVERTAERCTTLKNTQFMCLDLSKDPLPGQFGLIVCSEVLYYVGELEDLKSFARKVADALEPGGYFLTTHANLVVDEPESPGYNWNHPFGAKVIGETFASTPTLRLVKELRTPLYRIQLFQRDRNSWFFLNRRSPEIIELPQPTPPPPTVADMVLWNGGSPQSYTPPSVTTEQLPILMYHRIAPVGSPTTTPYRVTPEAFEEQLRYLRDSGYYSISLEDWRIAAATKQSLPGRAILFTFDDGYLDFFTYAWPLLKKYGFSAIVFLVTKLVGQSNQWDAAYGEELPLMNWQQIEQLQAEGVEFGSHSVTHRPLTSLPITEIVQEGVRSRKILTHKLGRAVHTFAYPYGDSDKTVEHLIGACGYTFGLSCRSGFAKFQGNLLALPRIEISGSDGLKNFVKKLQQ